VGWPRPVSPLGDSRAALEGLDQKQVTGSIIRHAGQVVLKLVIDVVRSRAFAVSVGSAGRCMGYPEGDG